MTLHTMPRATYRLQFHKGFTLDDAAPLVPYFAALGISHIYASPLLTAQPGSMHGYDVIDPSAINPELGGLPALERLVQRLRAHGMGLLLDIVPNHMGIGGSGNAWWQDVLEFGRRSRFAGFFDIEWTPPCPTLHGRLLAPFLGAPYGTTLESGAISLKLNEAGGLVFQYHEHAFPLSPRSAALVLRGGSPRLARLFAMAAAQPWPASATAAAKAELLAFHQRDNAALPEQLARFSTPQRLHQLLRRQHYRLAWWRTASTEINWRRFFDINTLAGLKVEQPDVFTSAHEFILRLYAKGLIDGVRIDHVDGLAAPGAYLRKLRRAMAASGAARPADAAQGPPYIVVEKILAPGETLPARWRSNGTTGYDFMDQVSAVLHDPDGEAPLSAQWERLTGRSSAFSLVEEQARRQILRDNLAGELDLLTFRLTSLARQNCRTADFSAHVIHQGLEELLAAFPVYRIYAGPGGHDNADARAFDEALTAAQRHMRKADWPVLKLLRQWLLEARPCQLPPGANRNLLLQARTGFQQLSSPTAAKSVEDTAFYRFGRLLSRNEVGSNPGHFSMPLADFHTRAAERGRCLPGALLATATHDHKRGEDTRARLAVLSEIPDEWGLIIKRWMKLNDPIRAAAGPSAADELMLYQMLAAAWPLRLEARDQAGIEAFARRVAAWQQKSLREAKLHSEWSAPDEPYETACGNFLSACLDAAHPMLGELIAFASRIAAAGAINGLSQTLLRLTVPGVPDLYQGTEFWDQSFVDPDNRRPVDFAAREAGLRADQPNLAGWRNGQVKQHIIARALGARRRMPDLMVSGTYQPLYAEGEMTRHVIAFRRSLGSDEIIATATRLAGCYAIQDPLLPPNTWGTTRLPLKSGCWRDLLTNTAFESDGSLPLSHLLTQLPVALLQRL